jgi:hypothetical protein
MCFLQIDPVLPLELENFRKIANLRESVTLKGLIVAPPEIETANASVASPNPKRTFNIIDIKELLHFIS